MEKIDYEARVRELTSQMVEGPPLSERFGKEGDVADLTRALAEYQIDSLAATLVKAIMDPTTICSVYISGVYTGMLYVHKHGIPAELVRGFNSAPEENQE